MSLKFMLFLLVSCLVFVLGGDSTTTLSNSCENLDDGYHLLKLMEDGPIIYAQCSNGFMILNPSLDSTISKYFTTWAGWHHSLYGPSKSDNVNWKSWYLPNDENTIYFPTETCDTCYLLDDDDFEINTGYYMNGNLFGCIDFGRGVEACDWDFWTYECRYCPTSDFQDHDDRVFKYISEDSPSAVVGECGVLILAVNSTLIAKEYSDCSTGNGQGFRKPSIGINGKFCICTQPMETKAFEVSTNDIEDKLSTIGVVEISSATTSSAIYRSLLEQYDSSNQIQKRLILQAQEMEDTSSTDEYHLYQTDFESGTYRILKPGTYILEEDITLDFKANYDDPNAEGAWFPVASENDIYPGAGQERGSYYLGFFAGITIEANNVVLDLNDHKFRQSLALSIQQSFFALIELGSQPFLPGQGIGFFGSNPQLPSDITIMNGELGLTSHHAIHGNYNKNVVIKDLKIYNFQTHAIQLNGFENVLISNVDIGPSTSEAYVTAGYGHARALLYIARILIEDENVNKVHLPFYGRKDQNITIVQVVDQMITEMDMIFNHIVKGIDYDDEEVNQNDETIIANWKEAKQLFLKTDGIPYGSAMYGIFLNYPGASIQSYHLNDQKSYNAVIENVRIHDMYHKTFEALQIKSKIRSMANVFNAPFEASLLFNIEFDDLPENVKEAEDLRYQGNPLYDFFFGLYYLCDNWDYLGLMSMGSDFENWIFGDDDFSFTHVIDEYRCNSDSMGHPNKGTVGLRLDGIMNATIKSVKISNILEDSDLGSDLCGEYETEFQTQRIPFQIGFSGNMVQGMSLDYSTAYLEDIVIDNIESSTGLTTGISLWYGSIVKFSGDVEISNIKAGAKVETGTLTADSLPNHAPEACAIRVPDLMYPQQQLAQKVTLAHNLNLHISCVSGHMLCNGLNSETNTGEYSGCTSDTTELFGSRILKDYSRISMVSIISTVAIILMISVITYKKYWTPEKPKSWNRVTSYTFLK